MLFTLICLPASELKCIDRARGRFPILIVVQLFAVISDLGASAVVVQTNFFKLH